jgi:HEAT repeat protein
VTDDVEVYLARLRGRLKDTEPSVRFATVQCIGLQTDAPELSVPLLMSVLGDTNDHVSSQAANALSGFGTNAASAFSMLTNLLFAGRPGQTTPALKALAAIAPTEALPILSNAVATGSPATFRIAVRSLKSIEPELALEMTLAAFHSSDRSRRSQAINAALEYEMTSPGLAGALKSAATDADPEIARNAVMTMKEMLRKEKEQSRRDVQLPNEPIYQGKPLGEWLKMRSDGWGLSSNAVAALRQGTNVIPALLARITYKEPVFNLGDFDVSMGAAGALISLREEAMPALPTLIALMDTDDRDTALLAMIATCGTGTNAIPCLIKGLTNRFEDVRSEAGNFLAQGAAGVPSPEQRKQALPFFIERLSDSNEDIRKGATNQLKEFDPKAVAAVGIR